MKAATLFSGFGGVDIALVGMGYTMAWGIEYDHAIATVSRENLGDHIITADILTVDPAGLSAVDWLHASPPCPSFSDANSNRGETEHDIALAKKVVDFIHVLKPRIFTLENVRQYQNSASWQKIIKPALWACGYMEDCQMVNFAHYGVPQSRKRMIVRAVRGGFVPYIPPRQKKKGWYQAVADLLPDLPDSQPTQWQRDRIPADLRDNSLVWVSARDGGIVTGGGSPTDTITKNTNMMSIRAYLVDGQNSGQEWGKLHRTADEPATTVTIKTRPSHMPKAFLANGGRWVKMSPRCLARFQTFPDWYQLPDKASLACKGIGNAVPPVGFAEVCKGLDGQSVTK